MIVMRFVDTNILLYRISNDAAEADKAAIAAELLRHPDLALSVQVLQEYGSYLAIVGIPWGYICSQWNPY